MNLTKQFFKYVSQNIFGLLGTSCYILADTYFIAQAAGTDGVTLLNLCLPIYNLIFAFGSMIGLGAATRYAILRAQGDARAQRIRKRVGLPVRPQLPQQGGADGFFFFQKIKHSLTPCFSKRKGREGRAAASFPPFGALLPQV